MCVDGKLLQVSMTGYSNQFRIIAPFFIIIFVYTDMKLETSATMFYLLELLVEDKNLAKMETLRKCQVKKV